MTFPIVSSMIGAPKVRSVRGFSDFGYSYVYIIFEDGTDIYWARSRIQEYCPPSCRGLPDGVRTELGPDATSLGWIFQYALVDESGADLAELRSCQDWYLRYHLKSVSGVAEVAPIGGFGKQYQVQRRPEPAPGVRRSRSTGSSKRSVRETGKPGGDWSNSAGPEIHGPRPRLRALPSGF